MSDMTPQEAVDWIDRYFTKRGMDEFDDYIEVLRECVSNASNTDQQMIGADLFRRELVASTKTLFHVHIGGVFAVFVSKMLTGDRFPRLPDHFSSLDKIKEDVTNHK